MSDLQLGVEVANTSPATFPGPDSINGKQVTLERLSSKHTADLYSSVGCNSALWNLIPDGPFSNSNDFADFINTRSQASGFSFYAIIPHSTRKASGYICLFRADLPHRVVEVGHVLFGGTLQKTRAGTEVLYLLGRLVFQELGFRRWEWKCNSLNAASRRAAERYGFAFEGTFRQHMIVKGRNRNSCWYSMIDGEWPACARAFEKWLADENFDEAGRQKRSLKEVREGPVVAS